MAKPVSGQTTAAWEGAKEAQINHPAHTPGEKFAVQSLRVGVAVGWTRVAGGRGPEELLLPVLMQWQRRHYTVVTLARAYAQTSGRRVGARSELGFEQAHALEQALKCGACLGVGGHCVGQCALLRAERL